MEAITDFLLVQCNLTEAHSLDQAAHQFCTQSLPVALHRAAWSAETGQVYVYFRLVNRQPLSKQGLDSQVDAWLRACPSAVGTTVSRLQQVFDKPGHSQTETPLFHYVVEMDPEAGWQDELFRWYDTEHMPGLAAVPGCISTKRLLNHDHGPAHGPLSLACYDLVSRETLGSPPWLAVRNTAWSDIARPHFTHTRRTMMRVVI